MNSIIHPENLYWARPVETGVPVRTGVLVLDNAAGDQGVARADMLASIGVGSVAMEWSGGFGQPVAPRLVPLELFSGALDFVAAQFDRVVVWGHGRGAEAALLLAALDDRVDGVIVLAPTDVVWQGADLAGKAPASSWTLRGEPLPFVPRVAREDARGSCQVHEQSRAALSAEKLAAATIPVERIRGEVVCVAGGADRVWPSATAATSIESRRTEHGLATRVVFDSLAGHQVIFPAEIPDGTDVTSLDAQACQLGRLARPAVRRVLGIPELS